MVRTNETRDKFAKRIERENKAIRELLDIRQRVYIPLLKKWDGKVYNKRFRTAIEDAIKEAGIYVETYVKESRQHHEEVELHFYQYPEKGNYCHQELLMVMLRVRYDNGNYRISEADTLADHYFTVWADNAEKDIRENEQAINYYEDYMEVASNMEKAINAFNELPFAFRSNISKYQFAIYGI